MLSPKVAKYHAIPNDSEEKLLLSEDSSAIKYSPYQQSQQRRLSKILAPLFLISLFVGGLACTGWMLSSLRQELIAIQYVKCASPPWYLFTRRPSDAEHYTPEELYLPGNASTNKVGMIQTCSVPVKRWSLELLLENHRRYAERWNVPWQVRVDIKGASWSKIIAAKEWMEKELEKLEEERLQWLFFTDVDTLLVNPELELSALLPPEGIAENAFLIMTKDMQGWNSGTWLARINTRSIDFFTEVLSYQHHIPPLWIADQSAIVLLAEKNQLEEKGEMVAITQQLMNSYDGPRRFVDPADAFLVHWPSLHFKRTEMLPFLRKLVAGEIKQDESTFRRSKEVYQTKIKEFWKSYSLPSSG